MSDPLMDTPEDRLIDRKFSLFRRTLLAGLGATLLVMDTSQKLFDRLVERGMDARRPDPYTNLATPIPEPNGHMTRRRLAFPRRRSTSNPDGEIEVALEWALEQRGLVGSSSFSAWSKQLDELNQQLDALAVGRLPAGKKPAADS